MEEKMTNKRKTKTSNEVKKRYEDKAYKKYLLRLRHDTDKELIKYIESEQEKGKQTTEIFRELGNIALEKLGK